MEIEAIQHLQKVLHMKYFAAGKCMPLTVRGDSMLPGIQNGDAIAIQKCEMYELGDVLVFWYEGELLVHRMVQKEVDSNLCKGDHSFRLERVPTECIIGKVVCCRGQALQQPSDALIQLSLQIGIRYQQGDLDQNALKKTQLYAAYQTELDRLFRNPQQENLR